MTDNNQVCYYLEAAPSDVSSSGLAWASSDYTSTNIAGTETAIGTGRKNTTLILATDANAPAAKACKDYTNGGKTDWFLPSQSELSALYTNRTFGGIIQNTYMYWSSSQPSANSARAKNLTDGGEGGYAKYTTFYVRAVRAF